MILRLATYNIHGCVGVDGKADAERILRILRHINADVVALQEVESTGVGGVEFSRWLARNTDYEVHSGPTLRRREGHYGNALLSRLPTRSLERRDLSVPGREPRGAIVATLDADGRPLLVVATHLGLKSAEREFQVESLLQTVRREIAHEHPVARVLLGDINEWCSYGAPLRKLDRYFQNGCSPATFPSRFPLLALDRILVRPHSAVRDVGVNKNEATRVASDHLPLLATINL